MSPLLKRLEGAGLVRRARRPDDERSVEIALTEAGEVMRADATDVPSGLSCAMGLDDDDAATDLRATLRHLTASVNDAASAPPPRATV
jgi:DNA-binding MarR family transcriptional regulator